MLTLRYIGNPSVVTCTEEDSTYKLKGCEKKVFCYAPTVLGQVLTRAFCTRGLLSKQIRQGYRVDEKSLVMQAFDVTAKCADGFHGSAKVRFDWLTPPQCSDRGYVPPEVTACSKEGAYSVTGCTENLCTAPSTVGRTARIPVRPVPSCGAQSQCRWWDSRTLPGYAVKEVELREHSFKAGQTSCAIAAISDGDVTIKRSTLKY